MLKRKIFPLLIILPATLHSVHVLEVKNTYLIQPGTHALAALQIACFHAVFIFIAFIAQPLHTALTMAFHAAMVFCLTTTFMLLYASFHAGHYVSLKRRKFREFCTNFGIGVVKTFVFIFFLFYDCILRLGEQQDIDALVMENLSMLSRSNSCPP